jgi:hypothetical protein
LNLLQSDCDIFGGVFLFMKNTYKTKTKIENQWVVIEVYCNGDYWFTYDFLIELSEMMLNQHLLGKIWVDESNWSEIREAINKHFLSK